MTERIVVGADGSAPSREAITWAVARAQKTQATLELVYVSDVSPFSREPVFLDEAISAAEDLLSREREFALAIAPELTVTTSALPGLPVRELARRAVGSSLLVIGTHKGSHLQDVVVGTRGIKLAAISPVPVAVIPQEPRERRGVVVGIDEENTASEALSFAVAEAKALGEPLSVVYAWALPIAPSVEYAWSPEIVNQIRGDAENYVSTTLRAISEANPGLELSGFAVQGSPVAALVKRAESASVLVVGNRGRKGLSRLLLGSVSHGVLNNIPAPVVVVRSVPVPQGSLEEDV